jgi:DNA polymerase-1
MYEIYLIDASFLTYRSYYALKTLSSKQGIPTGAIFGFARTIISFLEEKNPVYAVCAFDTPVPTFRHKAFKAYKANRPPTPPDLQTQIPTIKEIIANLGIDVIEKDGFEADDIIATLCKHLPPSSHIYIVTSDKDLMQLVKEKIKLYDPFNDIVYDKDKVKQKLGICPHQVADYLALVGDKVDNIPGVKGIGKKTAVDLLNRFQNIEGIIQHLNEIPLKIKKSLVESKEKLGDYKKLTLLDDNVPISADLQGLHVEKWNKEKLRSIFEDLNFSSLMKYLNTEHEKSDKGKEAVLLCDEKCTLITTETETEVSPYDVNNAIRDIDEVIVYDAKSVMHKMGDLKKPFFDIKAGIYLLNSDTQGEIKNITFLLKDSLCPDFLKLSLSEKLFRLYPVVKEEIHKLDMDKLFYEIEQPLEFVIYNMEKDGIRVDTDYLLHLKNDLIQEEESTKNNIFALSGKRFNINSTKELQDILFKSLGLKPAKKIKTGFSTDSETLFELAKKHELPAYILQYRTIQKLLNTYVEPLLNLADEKGRVHTTFNLTATSTGRLSSSNPNLQNIPTGDTFPEDLRKAVVAEDGYSIICSDYSQIELRIMAALSRDEELTFLFRQNKDMHNEVASHLFGVKQQMVTSSMRRTAKTINFGIMYGMGANRLRKTLNISLNEAKSLIERYFSRFPKVKSYIEGTIQFARKNGYVKTYFGRRRYFHYAGNAEQRKAVNAPIQGTAADIIKIAMVRLFEGLKKYRGRARIVLQVHDELLLEVEDEIIEEVKEITKNAMEDIDFPIQLKVNIGVGKNWTEAKV